MTETIAVQERGRVIVFSFDDLMRYHGPGSPAGVANAFKVLQRAFLLLSPDAPPLHGPGLLDQVWRDLTFLHWRVDPQLVAPLLPPAVRPDTYDGSSWVGLIPFRLTDARFGSGPVLPWVGSFAETNVRLYAVDDSGRRGVVFASLESERLAFVLGSRVALNIPYTWARMRMRREGDRLHSRKLRAFDEPPFR